MSIMRNGIAMKTKVLVALLNAVVCLAGAAKAQSSDQWCAAQDIPLQSPQQVPLQFDHLMFNSQETFSGAQADVTNLGDKEITYYLILVEFYDEKNVHLITIPFYDVGVETHLETPFPITFSRWLYANGASVATFKPKSPSVMWGNSPTVLFTCPRSARISMVQLRYADGQTFHYAASDLTLNPVVTLAPLSDKRLSQWSRTFVYGRLLIDANGHPKLDELSGSSSELSSLIRAQVEGWSFSPPVVGGQQASAEIGMLLYLEDVGAEGIMTSLPLQYLDRLSDLRAQGFKSPLVVIHAYRRSSSAKQWIVRAGGVFVNELDERQR